MKRLEKHITGGSDNKFLIEQGGSGKSYPRATSNFSPLCSTLRNSGTDKVSLNNPRVWCDSAPSIFQLGVRHCCGSCRSHVSSCSFNLAIVRHDKNSSSKIEDHACTGQDVFRYRMEVTLIPTRI